MQLTELAALLSLASIDEDNKVRSLNHVLFDAGIASTKIRYILPCCVLGLSEELNFDSFLFFEFLRRRESFSEEEAGKLLQALGVHLINKYLHSLLCDTYIQQAGQQGIQHCLYCEGFIQSISLRAV